MPDKPAISAQEAIEAVDRSSRLLMCRPPCAAEAWETIKPCVNCESFSESNKFSDIWVIMILATAGDCQREMGNHRAAAEFYRQAGQRDGFYGYADFYATLVLEHQLPDHWDSARDAVKRQDAWWKQRSLFYRAASKLVWWCRWGLWRSDVRREMARVQSCGRRLLAEGDQPR